MTNVFYFKYIQVTKTGIILNRRSKAPKTERGLKNVWERGSKPSYEEERQMDLGKQVKYRNYENICLIEKSGRAV